MKVKILYSILNGTDSQCKCAKIGVICSLFFFHIKKRAAPFGTSCKRERENGLTKAYKVLQ